MVEPFNRQLTCETLIIFTLELGVLMTEEQVGAFLWRQPLFAKKVKNAGKYNRDLINEAIVLLCTELLGADYVWPEPNAPHYEIEDFKKRLYLSVEKAGYRKITPPT